MTTADQGWRAVAAGQATATIHPPSQDLCLALGKASNGIGLTVTDRELLARHYAGHYGPNEPDGHDWHLISSAVITAAVPDKELRWRVWAEAVATLDDIEWAYDDWADRTGWEGDYFGALDKWRAAEAEAFRALLDPKVVA